MFILARWRAPSDRWSGRRQRQRRPRDLVGIKRDYVTWRREPDLASWFRGIVALTLNKCKPRSLSQIETHRRSILFTGQWLQTSFWHVPRQQARLLRRLHWVLPRKDAKGTCQMLLDGTDIISVSPPALNKRKSMSKLAPDILQTLTQLLVEFDQNPSKGGVVKPGRWSHPSMFVSFWGMRKFCTPLLTKPKPEDLQWETVQLCLGCCGRSFKICQHFKVQSQEERVDSTLI